MWRLYQPTLVKIGSEVITGIINKSMFYLCGMGKIGMVNPKQLIVANIN